MYDFYMTNVKKKLKFQYTTEEPVCVKGNTLDRVQFENMRKEFYELRGWDAGTGLPKKQRLEALGLSNATEELEKSGLLKESSDQRPI